MPTSHSVTKFAKKFGNHDQIKSWNFFKVFWQILIDPFEYIQIYYFVSSQDQVESAGLDRYEFWTEQNFVFCYIKVYSSVPNVLQISSKNTYNSYGQMWCSIEHMPIML